MIAVRCLSLALLAMAMGADEDPVRAAMTPDPAGKPITPPHFRVGAGFHWPGVYCGALPADDARKQREEFAAALRAAGVRARRLPSGNECQRYLVEGIEASWDLRQRLSATMPLAWKRSRPEQDRYVRAEDLLRFCRGYGFAVAHELSTYRYWDGSRPRAIIRSNYLPADDRELYDRPRLAEAAAYIGPPVRFCVQERIPVAMGELGNEEFVHCWPEDRARLIQAYVAVLDRHVPDAPIACSLQGGEPGENPASILGEEGARPRRGQEAWAGWVQNLADALTGLGLKDRLDRPSLAGAIHYPIAKPWRPRTAAGKAGLERFAGCAFAPAGTLREQHDRAGYGRIAVAITETTVARVRWRDHFRVTPSFAHGLPSSLCGTRLDRIAWEAPAHGLTTLLAGSDASGGRVLVACNRGAAPAPLALGRPGAGAAAVQATILTADGLWAPLAAERHRTEAGAQLDDGALPLTLPPRSVVRAAFDGRGDAGVPLDRTP